MRDAAFKTNVFKNATIKNHGNEMEICLNQAATFNTLQLQEQIKYGQRVISFEIQVGDNESSLKKIAYSSTIGRKKIIQFPTVTAKCIKVKITAAKATPVLGAIAAYLIKE